MSNANGHGPKRAILYARVSTEEQARSGYSLAQQIEALGAYAAREGFEVLEEVREPGQSGASLARPGMDRVRDLVQGGGVSVVLAQDRDRFAREPAYIYLLRQEFAEQGCSLRALNDRGDKSPEGELTDGILDQLAKFERAKIAERTRRGKLQKARQGKIVATHRPPFGFLYNAERDNYVVKADEMRVVNRIFSMVAEDVAINAVKKTFDREGVPTPGGAKFWSEVMVRKILKNDVYKAHSCSEIKALVFPDVAATLEKGKSYGVYWFGRRRVTQKHVVQDGVYRTKTKSTIRPQDEQIAVPTPDPGIPRELIDAAREAIKDNHRPRAANHRFWGLSGGLARCGLCGGRMQPDSKPVRNKHNHYYRCARYRKNGTAGCANYKSYAAPQIEARVWNYVRGLLTNPETLREDLERMIELIREEMRGDPGREAQAWLRKVNETDCKRSRYQDMAAEGLIAFGELRAKLASLEETRKIAERELAALKDQGERIEAMERDKEAVLTHYAALSPVMLDELGPEERHRLYRILKLKVTLRPDAPPEASYALTPDLAPLDPGEGALLETTP